MFIYALYVKKFPKLGKFYYSNMNLHCLKEDEIQYSSTHAKRGDRELY